MFEAEVHQIMTDLNKRYSLSTAYTTWKNEWHKTNLENIKYQAIFTDAKFIVHKYLLQIDTQISDIHVEDIVLRIFYILSTTNDHSMSLATITSKLDADCKTMSDDYEENMNIYARLIYNLQSLGIFNYGETLTEHPVIEPTLQTTGELKQELESKFGSAIPQIGGVIKYPDSLNKLLPGISFSGKSTKRKTPLNKYDRETISLVSRQRFKVDMDVLNKMEYYVPSITETGRPISIQEQEYTRTAYYRFLDVAKIAKDFDTVIQLPTTQDSRGRFYNMATDPAIRLSLRSPEPEGKLNNFETALLEGKEYESVY